MLDHRRIVGKAGVVAGPGKEGGHSVQALPRFPRVPGRLQRQAGQQRAAAGVLVHGAEGQAAVPHHRPEIALQALLLPGIVAARDVLGVVLHQGGGRVAAKVHDRRGRGRIGRFDQRQLGGDRFGHRLRHGGCGVLQAKPDREEGEGAAGRVLPFGARQRVQLGLRGLLHRAAQLKQRGAELIALRLLLQVEEVEVIGVEAGIDRDEVGDIAVAVHLVAAEKFIAGARHDKETVLQQLVARFLRPIVHVAGVDDVGKIAFHRERRDAGGQGLVIKDRQFAQQPRQRCRGRQRRGFGRLWRRGLGGFVRLVRFLLRRFGELVLGGAAPGRQQQVGDLPGRAARQPGRHDGGQQQGKQAAFFHPFHGGASFFLDDIAC